MSDELTCKWVTNELDQDPYQPEEKWEFCGKPACKTATWGPWDVPLCPEHLAEYGRVFDTPRPAAAGPERFAPVTICPCEACAPRREAARGKA